MDKFFRHIDRLFEIAVAAIFAVIVLVGALQIFNRFVLNSSLSWSEEFQKFGHIWIVFLAIPIAHQRGMHINMDVVRRRFPKPAAIAFDIAIELLWVAFGVALMTLSYQVSLVAARQISPGLEVPMSYAYYGMVTGGAYLLFVSVRRLVAVTRRHLGGARD